MFGLKKKKTTDTKAAIPEEMSKFKVHTMQDDINEINGGGEKSKVANTDSLLDAKQGAPQSPFFADTPAPAQPTPKSSPWKSTPESSKKMPTENPFTSQQPKSQTPKEINTTLPEKPPANLGKNIANPTPDFAADPQKSGEIKKAQVSDSSLEKNEVKTKPFDEKSLTKGITLETSKVSERSPVNDIEAEMASFTKDQNKQLDTSGEKITTFSPLTQTPSEMFQDMGGPAKDDSVEGMSKPKKKGVFKKLLKVLITLLVLALIAIGGYFGYKYIQDQGALDLENIPGTDLLNQAQNEADVLLGTGQSDEQEEKVQEKRYALEFPNYIELEDDSLDSQEFSQKMQEIAQSLPLQNTAAPISFLITDSAGTPLTLRSFANLTNMKIPPAILDQAGDGFEIYAHEQAGDVRFGISFEYLDRQLMSNALTDNEFQLPQAFTPLYNTSQSIEPTIFADNVYGNYAVRFNNLRPDETISIDYTVADKVYVGTSKNSQRAILDKYASDEVQ